MTARPDSNHQTADPPIRIRMVHIFYAFALTGAMLATFGAIGLFPAIFLCAGWLIVFNSSSRPKMFLYCSLVYTVFFCCISLWPPRMPSFPVRRMECGNNLKQIGLALHNYHDVHGCLPPAYIADKDGKPMHSWRVLILPYIEEEALYKKYRFDEPWNGPNNSKLLNSRPRLYACPADLKHARGNETNYVAVIDPATAWPGTRGRTFSEFADGTSQSVLVMEYGAADIPWLEPRDIDLKTAVSIPEQSFDEFDGHRWDNFFFEYYLGRQVVLGDGTVKFFGNGSSPLWRQLFTISDGLRPFDVNSMNDLVTRVRPIYGNWYRLALVIALIVFPMPWVWLNPTSALRTATTGK